MDKFDALVKKYDLQPYCSSGIGDGWIPLVEELIQKLIDLGWNKKIAQIKEKFGTLRVYLDDATEEMRELVYKYEAKSAEICELCGKPGIIRGRWWVKCKCDGCVGMGTVAISNFVRRQTKDSRFSHFDGTDEELISLVRQNWESQKPGYREGVILIPVLAEKFYTSTIKVDEHTKLMAEFISRQEGEEKHIVVTAVGEKQPAKHADIVLYRKDVLAEDNDRSSDADWEIISINAYGEENPPMHPLTMARNFLHKKGGTKAKYTAEEFANAIWYWSQRAGVYWSQQVSVDSGKEV